MRQRHTRVLALLDQHGAALHRLVARITRCEHTTSDLMQELFICLTRSDAFGKASKPYAYAWKAAANLAFDWRRRQKVKLQPLPETSLPDEQSAPALAQMIQEEQFAQVLQCTTKLNELSRHVVIMRYIEQASYEQIAQRLGKDPGHMRTLCSKAISQLRHRLNKHPHTHTDREVSHG